MHRSPRLDLRLLRLSGSIHLEHHGHVVGKSSHCPHAFCVKCRLTFGSAISDIPILRCHDRYVAHLEWHLEGLEGCACASPSGMNLARIKAMFSINCLFVKFLTMYCMRKSSSWAKGMTGINPYLIQIPLECLSFIVNRLKSFSAYMISQKVLSLHPSNDS